MSSEQPISILSAIPNDSLNIIKEFLVETRKPSFLKVSTHCLFDFIVTKYKEGYKVDKVISMKHFESNNNEMTEEKKTERLKKFQKIIDKHFPCYIDTCDDVCEYLYNYYFNNCDEDEEGDTISFRLCGIRSWGDKYNFQTRIKLLIPLIGKIYTKA